MSDFFEFKYLAANDYYNYYFNLGYTHAQAASRCIYEFRSSMSESVVREIAVYSTVLYQFASRTKEEVLFISKYKHLIELCNSVALSQILNKNELKYLKEDLGFLQHKFISEYKNLIELSNNVFYKLDETRVKN